MTERIYCGMCGWPLEGSTCEACSTPAGTAFEGEDHPNFSVLAGVQPEDYPFLEPAFTAWRNKDINRFIGQCLAFLQVDRPQVAQIPEGAGWAFVQESAVIYLILNRETQQISIESPILRLSHTQRVPMMRTLLEMNWHALRNTRFYLRGDLVVLAFTDHLDNLSPPKLVEAIREVALAADAFDDELSTSFSAQMVGPEAQRRHLSWDFLGTPQKLASLKGAELGPLKIAPPAEEHMEKIGEEPESRKKMAAALGAAKGLCDLIRNSQEVLKALVFMEVHPAVAILAHRAVIFRIVERYSDDCTDAVTYIANSAREILSRVWSQKSEERTPQITFKLDQIYTRIVNDRGQVQVQPQAPAPFEVFKTVDRAKKHMRALLSEIEEAPDNLALRNLLILGAFAELLVRTPLKPQMAEKLRVILKEAERQECTPDINNMVFNQLKRLVA